MRATVSAYGFGQLDMLVPAYAEPIHESPEKLVRSSRRFRSFRLIGRVRRIRVHAHSRAILGNDSRCPGAHGRLTPACTGSAKVSAAKRNTKKVSGRIGTSIFGDPPNINDQAALIVPASEKKMAIGGDTFKQASGGH